MGIVKNKKGHHGNSKFLQCISLAVGEEEVTFLLLISYELSKFPRMSIDDFQNKTKPKQKHLCDKQRAKLKP